MIVLRKKEGHKVCSSYGAAELFAGYEYDTWENIISITGTGADTIGQLNPLRYRGYYYDTETEFYDLQSRYYDPETGRYPFAINPYSN